MSHNPNSQNNQSLNDEMAAINACPKDINFRPECDEYKCGAAVSWREGFISGCKYKTEQLANTNSQRSNTSSEHKNTEVATLANCGVSFDEATAANEGIEQMKLGVAVDSAYIRASRSQFTKLAPIINAQAERLKAAEGLIETIAKIASKQGHNPMASDLRRIMWRFGELIEKYRKGEG